MDESEVGGVIQELADATPNRECQLTPAPVPWSCRAWRVVRDVSCVRPTDRSMGPGGDRPFCGRDDFRRNSSCSPSPPDWLNVENLPCGNPTTTFPVLNFFLFQRLWKSVIKHFFESPPYTCPNFQTFLGKSWRFFTVLKIRVLARTRLQTFFSSWSGASIYHRCQIYYSASHVHFWHKNQCYFNNFAKKHVHFECDRGFMDGVRTSTSVRILVWSACVRRVIVDLSSGVNFCMLSAISKIVIRLS